LTRGTLTQIVAHRGASREAPENTLAAFAKAIEIGADMIEFDVRRAADGPLVVSHDRVRKGAHVPTLDDTLRLTKGRIQLDVELKELGCERDAVQLLLQYFTIGDFCITSFLPAALREVRAIDPGVRTGLIFATWGSRVQAACLSPDADVLVAHYRLAARAEQIGKPLFVWTVDDAARTRRLFERPLVEAIITNKPRQALALRSELQ
jgi:glycerophosphoryl diester phosphodiesterase